MSEQMAYNTGTEIALVDHFAALAQLLAAVQREVVILIHIAGTLFAARVAESITAHAIALLADAVGGALLVGVGAGAEGAGVLGTAVRHRAVEGGRTARVVVAENEAVGTGESGGAVLCVVGVVEEIRTEQIGAGDGAAIGMLVEKELVGVGDAAVADFDVGWR